MNTPTPKEKCNIIKNTEYLDYNDPLDPLQILKDSYLNLPYLYGNFSFNLEMPSNNYNNGTFGFGLWNTQLSNPIYAWIMNFESHNTFIPGLYAVVCNKKCSLKNLTYIRDKLNNSHVTISWTKNNFTFFINNTIIYSTNNKINTYLSYHIWIDNINYFYKNKKPTYEYLPNNAEHKQLIIGNFTKI
jgi:hypothetical protein